MTLFTLKEMQAERQAIEINLDEFDKGYAGKEFPIIRINRYVSNYERNEWIKNIVIKYQEIRSRE